MFELPVRPFAETPEFSEGLNILRRAEAAFRAGDWQGTVVESRRACEAALALHAAIDDVPEQDIKRAFDRLATRLFPLDQDKPRRDTLNQLLLGVATLRNAAAHARDPRFRVRREDAELVLGMVLLFFRYAGETLSLEQPPA